MKCKQWLQGGMLSLLLLGSAAMAAGPITITKGGTYTGIWVSGDPKQSVVKIRTTEPVTLKNCYIRGPGPLVDANFSGANLTVSNCRALGLNPNIAGVMQGAFLVAFQAQSLVIEKNRIDNAAGMVINGDKAPMTGPLRITNNLVNNVNGRMSDGHGGYQSSIGAAQVSDGVGHLVPWEHLPLVHFVGLDKATSVYSQSIDISWNQVINEPGNSLVEDVINIYLSRGTPDHHIKIHDNFLRGAYPADLTAHYYGGGIISDGEATVDGPPVTAYLDVEDNQVVDTVNHGVSIAAGQFVTLRRNKVVGLNLSPQGGQLPAANLGCGVWNGYYSFLTRDRDDLIKAGETVPDALTAQIALNKAEFHDNVAVGNTIGWLRADGARNDAWFPDCAPNTCGYTPIATLLPSASDDEFTAWQTKYKKARQQIGTSW
jgi:hypothetical protein